ncbi:MAG: DUF4286 family protein [Gammaproteobacteria bacterium]|nr:DUF4286 family protein [Gammaproteobacteria bacterium]
MTSGPGVVYEVSLAVEQDIVGEFDAWHADHIEEMLAIPGFLKARTFTLENDGQGRAQRVTHYHIESEADLERYLDGPAVAMRQAGINRFGDRFSASRRILHAMHGADAMPAEHCLNCKAILAGQYCANCGQRARSRLISLWELVSDAFGDLFELDSRLWRTLIPLFARPGLLTRDYLEGRRARFMPPFRTYLVLSIVFFLVAFFDPKENLQILFEPEEVSESVPADHDTADAPEESAENVGSQVLKDLDDAGVVIGEEQREKLKKANKGGFNISIDDKDGSASCSFDDHEQTELPQWLAKRLTKERLLQVCERVQANSGRDFTRKLLDNVPAALFILLPLMALVLKILYPLSKRYYVEHLLFVLHFHAFFFLVLTLQILFSRIGAVASIPEAITILTVVSVSLYIPVYLYKAMRHVYAQGHIMTSSKYLILVMAYAVGFALVMFIATLIAAFSM